MSKPALNLSVSFDHVGPHHAVGATRRVTLAGRLAARLLGCAALALLGVTDAAAATTQPYARMAPVDAYFMGRAQEIALARSAAPAAIAKKATVLVLTRTGYETAVRGSNGFVCWVARGFSGAPDWPERWNPKIRGPG